MKYTVLINAGEYAKGIFDSEEEARDFATYFYSKVQDITIEEAENELEVDADPARVIEIEETGA